MDTIRIILADDHSIVRNGIKSLLENESRLEVVGEASNGQEAIELTEKLQPHILLLDIKMPVMNGIEAAQKLRDRGTNTKILILSMHDHEDYVLQTIECGAYGYLLKDSGRDELVKAIYKVHGGEKHFSSDISNVIVNNYLSHIHRRAEQPFDNTIEDVDLTKREKQILKFIVQGYSNKEIAEEFEKSVRTIETHRFNIMKKLNVHNAIELMRVVEDNQLLEE